MSIFKKIIRIVCYFLLFLAIPFIILAIVLNVYVNKQIIENVKQRVSESTHGEYALLLDDLTINLLTNTITLNNLVIEPSKKDAVHLKPQYVVKAKVFKIIDFSILSYLRKHDLLIGRVEFEEPQIAIFQGSERLPKKKKDAAEGFSLYGAFSKTLNSVSVGNIDIINSKFNIYKNGMDTLSVFSTNDNSISIKNFSVNSETDKQNRLFVAEKFEVVMNKFSYHFRNELYTLHGKSLYASYTDSTLIIDSLQLVPNFSKKEFGKMADNQVSRTEMLASRVICQKMDVKLLFEYNSLVIHKVDLVDCAMDIYRDNTVPLKHIERPSIQAMVKGLPFFLAVDSIEMKNCEIRFQVLNPGENSTGRIAVNKLNAIITGAQNDTSLYTEVDSIKAKLSGRVLNQGKFNVAFSFPLKATKEFFYCSGSISSMPMASFNPMIEYVKKMSIKSGQLDAASFSFIARENSSVGKMKFLYHDLQVEVMNENRGEIKMKEKVKTYLANRLVVKDSNPGRDGAVRISTIRAVHNPYRYFLFYSMQSILSGIEPAIQDQRNARLLQQNN